MLTPEYFDITQQLVIKRDLSNRGRATMVTFVRRYTLKLRHNFRGADCVAFLVTIRDLGLWLTRHRLSRDYLMQF